jgi:ferredoxin
MMRIATTLPAGLVRYKQTPEFTRETVPEALLAVHNVKAGVWGLLRVLRGRVRYCLDEGTREALTVEPGGAAVIEPEVRHHVELLDADSVFLVEFHREKGGA